MSNFAIGVDLGGTNLRIAAVDANGTLLEKLTIGAQVARGRDFIIQEMCKAIKSVASGHREKGTLCGVGIGVPGIIDKSSGRVIKSPNLPDWLNYPVKEEIERQLQAPVSLENDANAAAIGEHWMGAGRDVDDMLIVTLGTGVGGGLVLNNQIWDGMTGMAGELGHVNIEQDGHPCGCGSRGCVEQLASATAILRMAKDAIAAGATGLAKQAAGDVEFSARSIFHLALQGDEAAQAIFDKVGKTLGILMADLVNIFNLPMYVIGGGVSSAWQVFSPALFEEVRKRSMVYVATDPESPQQGGRRTIITRALLGSDAGLFGAARIPFLFTDKQPQSSSRMSLA